MTRYLAGMIDLPIVTHRGRLISRTGYDPETRLYLNLPMDWQFRCVGRISPVDVRNALSVLVEPFRAYQFADADSVAGMLSGIFSAVSRPALDLCPGLLFDASTQGSGKTKAACALGAIIEGQRPGVTPFSGASTDDELRKRMVAGAIEGGRFQCVDNIVGHFKSSVLAAVLTSGRLSDRILGQSRMVDAHIRSLITLTANNCSTDADLQRRTVHVRIDSGANPTHRAFAFDPVTVALERRRLIADAVCIVQMAYFAAGAPDIVSGDAGGFADWNRLCRQPLLWASREGYTDVLPWQKVGDPAASLLADPSLSDPEIEATGALLMALWLLTQGRDFTSAEVLGWHLEGQQTGGVPADLRSAIIECIGKGDVNVRGIGRLLMYRRDRVVGDLKLLARASGRVKSWRVVLAESAAELQPALTTV